MAEILNPRKRRRDDLSCDLTTLAKRFKDLNLNLDCDACNSISSIYSFPTNHNYTDRDAECPAAAGEGYNPELGIDQNPFYYEKNKVLHDLHAERVRRSNEADRILADHIRLQAQK